MRRLNILISIILLSFTVSLAQDKEWKLESNKNDMQVYTRMSADSPIKELKIELDVDASLSQLVKILEDVDFYPNWIYSCSSSYVVEEVEKGDFYYYVEMDFPWPLSNRDLVQHSVMEQDPSTLEININTTTESSAEKVALKKDNIRLITGSIHWKLTPISVNKTHIYYHLVTNPGGNLPAWIVNMAIDLGPSKTMKKLKESVGEEKFKEGVEHVKDML